MIAGMALGMVVALPLAFLLSALFGALEVMLPVMTTGMIAGMVVSMAASRVMDPLRLTDGAQLGAGAGLVVLAACYLANAALKPRANRWTM